MENLYLINKFTGIWDDAANGTDLFMKIRGNPPEINIKICVLPLLFTRGRVTMLMQVGRLLVRVN